MQLGLLFVRVLSRNRVPISERETVFVSFKVHLRALKEFLAGSKMIGVSCCPSMRYAAPSRSKSIGTRPPRSPLPI
jgi:hypothetical protein